MGKSRVVRLVYPHQLFEEHLHADPATRFVLVEDDLLFRQYPFHAQKLVLHRASMRRFAARLREAGYAVDALETDRNAPSGSRLSDQLASLRPSRVEVFDVVDDWLARDARSALEDAGLQLSPADVLESPNFLTTRAQLRGWFAEHPARMQHFYTWQRTRLDVLVDDGAPVGGRWSFDTENRRKLPRRHPVPAVSRPFPGPEVAEAIDWVREHFPDAPGNPEAFAWPTSHAEASAWLDQFVAERLEQFGPFEDAVSARHPFLFHAALTPALNIGLLDPRDVLDRVLAHAQEHPVPLASLEGFVRQIIGWREYMRATYVLWGRRMRTSNRLGHYRPLGEGWWTARTGLDPVDHVVAGVLEHGWAHHIPRLMVLGNAMCLLRTAPDAVYQWFMEMFVDAYDWVMVPNTYAMSQFASGTAITTKPYVSSSNYLRSMSDLPRGDWEQDWDALFWTFVGDHQQMFAANHRARMLARRWDGLDDRARADYQSRAARWLAS